MMTMLCCQALVKVYATKTKPVKRLTNRKSYLLGILKQ